MKKPDLFKIPENQREIDSRLNNWAMWVTPGIGRAVCPMFKMAKSNSRQWHQPEIRPTCDTKDAQKIEKAIRLIPNTSQTLLRWYYVFRGPEVKIRRKLNLSHEELMISVIAARNLLQSNLS